MGVVVSMSAWVCGCGFGRGCKYYDMGVGGGPVGSDLGSAEMAAQTDPKIATSSQVACVWVYYAA